MSYRQKDGLFVLDPNFKQSKNERVEQFGFTVSYTGNVLAIGSKMLTVCLNLSDPHSPKKKTGPTYVNDPYPT